MNNNCINSKPKRFKLKNRIDHFRQKLFKKILSSFRRILFKKKLIKEKKKWVVR
jgi:hypothetical protein